MTDEKSDTESDIVPLAIGQFVAMAENWRGLPPQFVEDFSAWAAGWPQSREESSKVANTSDKFIWLELRPYKISELARQPGMPGRTRLHQIINSLPIDRSQLRNESGCLTPAVVLMILERLGRPCPKQGSFGHS